MHFCIKKQTDGNREFKLKPNLGEYKQFVWLLLIVYNFCSVSFSLHIKSLFCLLFSVFCNLNPLFYAELSLNQLVDLAATESTS